MKILMKVLSVIAVLVLVVSIIGFVFFSSHIHVERSIVINKDRGTVFAFLNDLKNQNQWSPWYEKDPAAKYEFSPATIGPGAEMKWDSQVKDVGKGSMKITENIADSSIVLDLNFMENGVAKGSYLITPEGNGTKVIWGLDVEAGANPLLRILGSFMDGMVGKDFSKGLANLKVTLEKMTTSVASDLKPEESTTAEINYLAIRGKAEEKNIGAFLGQSYQKIGAAMGKQKLQMAGAPFAIYYTNSSTAWELDAAIHVDKPGKADGEVKPGKINAGNVVVVHFFGDYSKTSQAHEAAHAYISAHNKTIIGAPWEVYVTDPGLEKDTAKWQTDIYYPIQ
jgi:effector-binding domain-containing protein/carbon monoxide dehydrogenase subunit G